MNMFRLSFIIFLSFIYIHLILTLECDEYSKRDDISFSTKVHESPLILIGLSLNKNFDGNIRNLFNVTFLVQCILKGQPTQRIIQIVQAGSLLGRQSCQRLHVNRPYIVFLEPFFDGTYRPVDFEEVPYNNQLTVLLEKTCGLSRTYPFTKANDTEAALTNKCPFAISVDCSLETTVVSTRTTTIIDSGFITTTSATLYEKNSMDLEILSFLLDEPKGRNFSVAFLQGPHHRSLFSDDETRKTNGINRLSYAFMIYYILFIVLYYIIE